MEKIKISIRIVISMVKLPSDRKWDWACKGSMGQEANGKEGLAYQPRAISTSSTCKSDTSIGKQQSNNKGG